MNQNLLTSACFAVYWGLFCLISNSVILTYEYAKSYLILDGASRLFIWILYHEKCLFFRNKSVYFFYSGL